VRRAAPRARRAVTVRARRLLRRPPARVLLAVALIAWGIGEALTLDGAWPVPARIAFVVAALAPLVALDRWPWAVVAVLLAAVAVHTSQEVIVESVTPLQGIVVAGWVAGAQVARRRVSVAALALLCLLSVAAVGGRAPFGTAVACALGWAGARVVVGVRQRRATAAAALRDARGEADALRATAVDAERMRLTRELDAVVLGAVREVGDEARRAQALLAADPEAARASLRRIAAATGAAIEQMRRALAVLRTDERDVEAPPRPDALEAAVALLRSFAVPVALRDSADDRDPATTLAAARVLETIAAGGWRPRRVLVRRDRRGARIVAAAPAPRVGAGATAPITADPHASDGCRSAVSGGERAGAQPAPAAAPLVVARIAERARLHGGGARLRWRPRPRDPRARVLDVRLPSLDGGGRNRIGAAGLVAGAVAGAATVVDVVTGGSVPTGPEVSAGALGIAASALLTAGAVTAAWTRRPACLVALAAVSFLRALPVDYVGLDSTTLPLMALTAFVTPLWLDADRARAAVAVALGAAGIAVMATSWSQPPVLSDVAILAASCVVPWLLGVAARDAAAETERLTALGWATARDDLVAAQRAVEDERRRVARDLHDLVGHGLALVSVQAWGAERALPAAPDRAAAALTAIRRVLADSVAELERLVAPWEEEPDADAEADVEAVVREARAAGLSVTLTARVGGRPVAAAEALAPSAEPVRAAVRRIVQEALTNVVRHAAAAPTTVTVERDGGIVAVTVVNAPAVPPAALGGAGMPAERAAPRSGGAGLAGMRERVEALGGSFAAGPAADGGFVVRATIG
jgi:signal transduction histidine kinase